MLVTLAADRSYLIMLQIDTKPTDGIENKTLLLEVDTATWFVFYDGIWYPQ